MIVWVAGADGAIGEACANSISQEHTVLAMKHEDADVQSGDDIVKFLGREEPDALVYAVGINILEWSDRVQWNEMLRLYDVNVVGLMRCLALAPTIKKCVVIGSDAATRPMRTSVMYNASKAALNAAVKCIARERAKDLQINVVAPGLIGQSDMTEYVYQRTRELRPSLDLDAYMLGQIPMGRPGFPREVADVTRWLLEQAPEYLNGAIIEVNGAR